MNPAKSKQALLDDIEQEIIRMNICSNLASSAQQLVFGSGDADAEIVFIGEAPGKKEDEIGKPFVGSSGQFLNLMLESIQLSRNQIYITNLVKYRPPNNRDPSQEEKQEFLPYLERQLNVIKPLLVVTLGRHSMNTFIPQGKISEIHGQPLEISWAASDPRNPLNLVVLPLYHPAAALYNGSLRKTLEKDFLNINNTLQKLKKG